MQLKTFEGRFPLARKLLNGTILTKKTDLRESYERPLKDLCKAYVKKRENSIITMGRDTRIYEKRELFQKYFDGLRIA